MHWYLVLLCLLLLRLLKISFSCYSYAGGRGGHAPHVVLASHMRTAHHRWTAHSFMLHMEWSDWWTTNHTRWRSSRHGRTIAVVIDSLEITATKGTHQPTSSTKMITTTIESSNFILIRFDHTKFYKVNFDSNGKTQNLNDIIEHKTTGKVYQKFGRQ